MKPNDDRSPMLPVANPLNGDEPTLGGDRRVDPNAVFVGITIPPRFGNNLETARLTAESLGAARRAMQQMSRGAIQLQEFTYLETAELIARQPDSERLALYDAGDPARPIIGYVTPGEAVEIAEGYRQSLEYAVNSLGAAVENFSTAFDTMLLSIFDARFFERLQAFADALSEIYKIEQDTDQPPKPPAMSPAKVNHSNRLECSRGRRYALNLRNGPAVARREAHK